MAAVAKRLLHASSSRSFGQVRNSALIAAYQRKAQAENFLPDACQAECLTKLDAVRAALVAGDKGSAGKAPRGLYMYGGVGVGKTMMLDLFHQEVTASGVPCQRQHFHEFLQAVHTRLHKLRGRVGPSRNLLGRAAEEYREEFPCLAFDEAHVLNVGDALMLRTFFEAYFNAGGVVVATSNVAPDDLYASGINREVFLPFLNALRERCDFFQMESRKDYRSRAVDFGRSRGAYFVRGCDAAADATECLDALHRFPGLHRALNLPDDMSCGAPATADIDVGFGRTLRCDNTWSFPVHNGSEAERRVVNFGFDELCRSATGPSEWVGLADFADAIVVTDVPHFQVHDEDAARRFITFVDIVYDRQRFLVITADTGPEKIFSELMSKYGGEILGDVSMSICDQMLADVQSKQPESSSSPAMKMPGHGLGSGRHGVMFQKPKTLRYSSSGAYVAPGSGPVSGDESVDDAPVPKAVSVTLTGGRDEHGFGSKERVMQGVVVEDSDWVEWSATGLKDASLFDLSPVGDTTQVTDKLLPFRRCASRLRQMLPRTKADVV
eukprot:gnl/TRDRNA2_/TRDRNA2_81452_c0_seq1.p1 gnl/TRDRNA2_/TRDRNA2_81452_c0~~gnl/TRDRNA2_/TRDRNA2_81452_c0_seq1.p1  ORF type:complete len:561 (+),score=98.79 gnl/TRDRNA2_/TRDRNA2_81452_c0_seq1:30-1685(+)